MTNLATEILQNAERYPPRVALQSALVTLTYAELQNRSFQAARVLRDYGVGEGSIVGMSLRNGLETVVAQLGVWLLGATCNIVDFRMPAGNKTALVAQFGHYVFLEDSVVENCAYNAVSAQQFSADMEQAPTTEVIASVATAPAYLTLSSGTTGAPSSTSLSHDGMYDRRMSMSNPEIRPVLNRYLSTAPMAFSGTQGIIINVLLAGGTVVLFPTVFRPDDLFNAIVKHKITGCALVPTVVRDLLQYSKDTGRTGTEFDPDFMLITHGGSISVPELLETRDRLCDRVTQFYGTAGCGLVAHLTLAQEMDKIDTVGRPVPGIELQIVDVENVELPQGAIGQLRMRLVGMGEPVPGLDGTLSSREFRNGWFYPGDLGQMDQDGYLRLIGRTQDVITRGGVSVYLPDVEAMLHQVDGVSHAAAIGFADDRLGHDLAVFVVTDGSVDETFLRGICRAQMASSHHPKHIVLVDSLPMNANGKPDRHQLAALVPAD